MSQNYNQFKVSELKSILQERGLSHSGTKSELISRLVEHDSSTATSDKKEESAEQTTDASNAPAETAEAGSATEAAAEPVAEPTTNAAEPAAEPATAESTSTEPAAKDVASESVGSAPEPAVEQPKQPSEEELFQSISEDIKIRIKRAKKFGGDANELEARLKRLEKFGVGSILDSRSKADSIPLGGKKRTSRKDKQLRSEGPKPAVD